MAGALGESETMHSILAVPRTLSPEAAYLPRTVLYPTIHSYINRDPALGIIPITQNLQNQWPTLANSTTRSKCESCSRPSTWFLVASDWTIGVALSGGKVLDVSTPPASPGDYSPRCDRSKHLACVRRVNCLPTRSAPATRQWPSGWLLSPRSDGYQWRGTSIGGGEEGRSGRQVRRGRKGRSCYPHKVKVDRFRKTQ